MVKRKTKKQIKKKYKGKSNLGINLEILKKDVVLGGFFTIAVGLIWLFITMGYIDISGFGIAGPFIIIVIGFLIAIDGARN